ncbi:CD63 antigen [Dendroctonus ponderosae]|uniref:Tetraspanin n=1 Tax=Dendroctonus ponderosae TaxID=77166 RepID=A0AAR5QJ10_DENPD|nr:CD63 antigen [Dendroctonus ponderosae]
MVSGGMTCVKYLLFCFNLLFAISGLAILVVGVIAHLHVYSQYSNFVYPSYQAAPIILITVGVIIFLISFFGCCGAVKENHCMIITFSVLLAIILVAETAAGVVGYINRNEVEVMLENKLNSTMYKYYTNSDIRRTWDIAQHELNCCGMHGPDDWHKVNNNDSLPHTCCPNAQNDGSCNKNTEHSLNSCFNALKTLLMKYASLIGAVGLGIAGFQVLGIIFACSLARHIRKEYETV